MHESISAFHIEQMQNCAGGLVKGRLSETRVVVTGGSSGIGFAIVRALAREGAFVGMAARAGQRLKDAKQLLRSEGLDAFAVVLDVESYESITEVVNLLKSHWGGVDVLFNCAGIGMDQFNPEFTSKAAPFYSFTHEQLRKAMDVNYIGSFAVTQSFMPVFIEEGHGRIINVGADESTILVRGFAPVGPARAATNALTMIMARELEGSSITANLLTPGGFVATHSMPADAPEVNFGRLLSPDIMGEPAVFLSSALAEGINGEHIVAAEFGSWISYRGLAGKWNEWYSPR